MLESLVDYGRMSPCGGNVQSLRYMLSADVKTNGKVFETLGWAKHLPDWSGPGEGERPTAYIIILNKKELWDDAWVDSGIAAQSILLGAAAIGLGGCMFRNVGRDKLRKNLNIPDKYDIYMVLAIGKPVEVISVDVLEEGGSYKYWRDENKVHHVPKRKLDDLILQGEK